VKHPHSPMQQSAVDGVNQKSMILQNSTFKPNCNDTSRSGAGHLPESCAKRGAHSIELCDERLNASARDWILPCHWLPKVLNSDASQL